MSGFISSVPDNFRGFSHVKNSQNHKITPNSFQSDLLQMVKERPGLTAQVFNLAEAKNGVEHAILTEGPPIRCKPRRQTQKNSKLQKSCSIFMVEVGIAAWSCSPWACPLHIAPKPWWPLVAVGGRWWPLVTVLGF